MTQHMHNFIAITLGFGTVMVLKYRSSGTDEICRLIDTISLVGMVVTMIGFWFILP